jgi:trk system potassium uptake protein
VLHWDKGFFMKCCVIGLGRFGYQVATTLAENGVEVMAVDSNESIVASIRDKVTQAICMHVTDEASLRSIGVVSMDVAVVAIGENLAQSITIAVFLKKGLKVPRVIARAVTEIHRDILKLVGADRVVLPEKDTAVRVADGISAAFVDIVRINKQFSVIQLMATKANVGKTIKDLGFFENYDVHCVGVKDANDNVMAVGPSYVVQASDRLFFAGLLKDLEKMIQ